MPPPLGAGFIQILLVHRVACLHLLSHRAVLSLRTQLLTPREPVAECPNAKDDTACRYGRKKKGCGPLTAIAHCADERQQIRAQPNERKPKQPRTDSLNKRWIGRTLPEKCVNGTSIADGIGENHVALVPARLFQEVIEVAVAHAADGNTRESNGLLIEGVL
jgi:hypothetical protein